VSFADSIEGPIMVIEHSPLIKEMLIALFTEPVC